MKEKETVAEEAKEHSASFLRKVLKKKSKKDARKRGRK